MKKTLIATLFGSLVFTGSLLALPALRPQNSNSPISKPSAPAS
ncbi:hypothetical protein [Shewanella sp. cp20]